MALAAARNTASKSTNCYPLISYKVKGSTTIYAGGMVMLTTAGYAVPASAIAANKGVVGVATETINNSAGADGDLEVVVERGRFRFVGVNLAIAQLETPGYASDDLTFSATQGANQPVAGIIERIESATDGWIRIEGPALNLAITLPEA